MSVQQAVDAFSTPDTGKQDRRWATRAAMRLAGSGLTTPEIVHALEEANDLAREAGEPAEHVLGDPVAWASGIVAERSDNGGAFTHAQSGPHDVLIIGLFSGAMMAVLVAVLALFKGGSAPFDAWLAAVPVVVGMASVAAITIRERLLGRLGQGLAALLAITLGAVTVAVTIVCVMQAHRATSHGWSLWLLEGCVLFALAAVTAKFVPARPAGVVRGVGSAGVDDARWLLLARGSLRERGDLTDGWISAHLDEITAHAAATGRPLVEEFGNPLGYAHRLPENRRVRHRRAGICWTIVLALTLVNAWASPADAGLWWRLACVAIVGVQVVQHWAGYVRSGRRVRARRTSR